MFAQKLNEIFSNKCRVSSAIVASRRDFTLLSSEVHTGWIIQDWYIDCLKNKVLLEKKLFNNFYMRIHFAYKIAFYLLPPYSVDFYSAARVVNEHLIIF